MTQAAAVKEARHKGANVQLANYLSEANTEMKSVAGIAYFAVMRELHGGNESLRRAFDRGVSPASFVSEVVSDFGFASVKGKNPEDVAKFNLTKAAIIEYSGSVGAWNLGKAGTVYSQNDHGIAIMSPKKDGKSGKFIFLIEQHDGATVSPNGDLIGNGESKFRAAGFDIADAVANFGHKLDREYGKSAALA